MVAADLKQKHDYISPESLIISIAPHPLMQRTSTNGGGYHNPGDPGGDFGDGKSNDFEFDEDFTNDFPLWQPSSRQSDSQY